VRTTTCPSPQLHNNQPDCEDDDKEKDEDNDDDDDKDHDETSTTQQRRSGCCQSERVYRYFKYSINTAKQCLAVKKENAIRWPHTKERSV
jgi:hypothetical protein